MFCPLGVFEIGKMRRALEPDSYLLVCEPNPVESKFQFSGFDYISSLRSYTVAQQDAVSSGGTSESDG